QRWAEAVCLARDLASTPGQDLTPSGLGERAEQIARQSGATARVLGTSQLERLGRGALLGVGRGSAKAPWFIVLERNPERSGPPSIPRAASARRIAARGKAAGAAAARGSNPFPTVVVIGKGVTFDTGGISLKPRENMHKMKY